MEIKLLNETALDEIATVFNYCFQNYYVPIHLSKDQLLLKMLLEDIHLDYSVACVYKNECVGFILHGLRNTFLYNAGTGVLPAFRGQNWVYKMYQFLFESIKEKGIQKIVLEVIDENTKAISAYQKVGFTYVETLHCYKTDFNTNWGNQALDMVETKKDFTYIFSSWWDKSPQWQNDVFDKLNQHPFLNCIVAKKKGIAVGYALINTINQRLLQIAVHPQFRRQGIGSSLCSYILTNKPAPLSIINVSHNNHSLTSFLESAGCILYLKQWRMELNRNHLL